jgi:hypothetical protein
MKIKIKAAIATVLTVLVLWALLILVTMHPGTAIRVVCWLVASLLVGSGIFALYQWFVTMFTVPGKINISPPRPRIEPAVQSPDWPESGPGRPVV